MAENTFLGLQPYTEDDAYRFKGRAEESQELFRLIVRNDYTVCYAESGEGKTSLLNAGVFPLLRQNMYFPIAITFTSDDYRRTPDSFDTIIDRCIRDSIADYNEKNKGINVDYKLCSTDFQGLDCQTELQQELSQYSWWKLRNYKPQAMGLTFTPVFVFDQFEEVFNLPGSIVWTKKLFDWLEEVSSDSCSDEIVNKVRKIIGTNAAFPAIKEEKDFKAVFSLRKEFIGELDYWGMQKCFIPSMKDNRYCLKALTYEGAKKVMTLQNRFEETKVEQVLHYFVQQYSREPEKTIAEKDLPVIPALLLSVVCDSWEKDIDYFNRKEDNKIGDTLNKILEKFFDKSISIVINELYYRNYGQIENIRENIDLVVFPLVDSNGKRVRRKITSSRFKDIDFNEKYRVALLSNDVIKVVNYDDTEFVELAYESWCPLIDERKKMKYVNGDVKMQKEVSYKESNHIIDFREEIETALFALVDSNGKRVRRKITSSRFKYIDFDAKYKKILSNNRIIKITKIDGEEYIELVHDSLCHVILKKKEQRLSEKTRKEAEETHKREEQRINVTSFTLLSIVMIFIIWFISSVFQDSGTLQNLISEPVTVGNITTWTINTYHFNIFGASLVNLLIIPILIYSSVKRLTITSWLSVYGVISNILLMCLFVAGYETEMSLRWSFATIVILVPVITLYYSIKERLFGIPQKHEIWSILKSVPLMFFYLFVSSFLFYLCIFNRALGLTEPHDSFWGVIIIPLLTHEIIRRIFVYKQNIIAFIVLCCFWGLLAYNTFSVPFALPSYIIICIIIATLGVIIWTFWGMGWRKNIIAVLLDVVVLAFVLILNMGFNVNRIKYDSVSHVFNWVDVMVYNQENKTGVVTACTGDTILPCLFDSIDYRQHYVLIKSNKLYYEKDVTDYKCLFKYNKTTNSALWSCLFIDEVENNISKIKNSKPGLSRYDSIRVYAARVYHEVRNSNIKYFKTGKMYSLGDVLSIDTLVRLQNNELSDVLDEMYDSSSSDHSKLIDVSKVVAFNKAFARSFYLCMLKDRILQKDSVYLFSLIQEIITLYFYDAGEFELNINSYKNINVGNIHKSYYSTLRASDLRKNTLDSWYNYVNMLLGMDMGSNANVYSKDKANQYMEILTNLNSISDRFNQVSKRDFQKMSEILRKRDKMGIDELVDVLNLYKKQLEFTKTIKEQTNTQIDKIDIEKEQIDSDLQRLINDVFVALSHVVLNCQNIYNSEFVDICEQLYIISFLRQYKITPIYLQCLEQMYNAKNPVYQEFKNIQEQEDSLKRKINAYKF